jgi:hypothetical protein
MNTNILPGDASSLLVPVHLDAWVVDSANRQSLAWYYANYDNLSSFISTMPDAFNISDASSPDLGVHLHWALPDALTHGKKPEGKANAPVEFPLAPNRWLVVRFNTTKEGVWKAKLWVVESDYLSTDIGKTTTALATANISYIDLAAGIEEPIGAGADILITDHFSKFLVDAKVKAASAVGKGAIRLPIIPFDFSGKPLSAGSIVTLPGTSSFLNPGPDAPTKMHAAPGTKTIIDIRSTHVGTHHTIEAWEASSDESGELFLTAVGPGNISFAAYVPAVRNVFSFTDQDLPPEGTGVYNYSYLVTGWYSDITKDPMQGVKSFITGIWPDQKTWANATTAERFKKLLAHYKWSVSTTPGATPPATSLYHGYVADVQWPFDGNTGIAGIDPANVLVSVGSTSIDAFAAIIQAVATRKGSGSGATLSSLMQASMYDLMDDFDKTGGPALMRQKILQASFGSDPGGTIWEVVSDVPQTSDQSAKSVSLTYDQAIDLNKQLSKLNADQQGLDKARQKLESMQAELYMIWMKVAMGNSSFIKKWGKMPHTIPPWPGPDGLFAFLENNIYPGIFTEVWDQYCLVATAQSSLPDPSAKDLIFKQWTDKNWSFTFNGKSRTLSQLGLKLKATINPRFWHPNDPVLMISGARRAQKFGEDGRYNKDGTLTCRLPGQTITGIQIPGQPAITIGILAGAGVNMSPYPAYYSVPSIPSLLKEAFLMDPLNAGIIANAVKGDKNAIANAINGLNQEKPDVSASWIGTLPSSFSFKVWQQAWVPLYLEWKLHYFPTGSGDGFDHRFSASDWTFDGEKYVWNGTGYNEQYFVSYKGRTILTPQSSLLLKDKIQDYLKNHPEINTPDLDSLIETISGTDVISQSLSGLTNQLVTLLSQEAFPPPLADMNVSCPQKGATPPTATALIGEQYHNMPLLQGTATDTNSFYPVRGGFIQFQHLQIVDSYGQTFSVSTPNTPQGFIPLIGQGLLPNNAPQGFPGGMVQLPPRIIQSSRLNIRILANDKSGGDIITSPNKNPVCGWLLPNHLDGGIAVYDEAGIALGEMLPLSSKYNWRPRPGLTGIDPLTKKPEDIKQPVLRRVVRTFASQSNSVFSKVMKVIDETLWMVDPLGGRRDQMLSVLIGRPLAVVQAELNLELLGNPKYNQLWNYMAIKGTDGSLTWHKEKGEICDVPFKVRLGSLDLRHDGLIGYFIESGADIYSTFYTVHDGNKAAPKSNSFIKQVFKPDGKGGGVYNGDISLLYNGQPVRITMLIDPRGELHAYTGILPVTSAALPANLIEDFIRELKVTFQTGPIIADPGTLRMPQPAEDNGVWSWIQATTTKAGWTKENIVDADDKPRMPDEKLQLREGWLQLSDIQNADPDK